MTDERKRLRDDLLAALRDLGEAERRRRAIPRDSRTYVDAEADEERMRERVWKLVQRTERSGRPRR